MTHQAPEWQEPSGRAPATGIEHFENSRRATYVQRQYAIDNPPQLQTGGRDCRGMSASDASGSTITPLAGNGVHAGHFYSAMACSLRRRPKRSHFSTSTAPNAIAATPTMRSQDSP